MIRKFISLEWKQFMRSPNLAENTGISIVLIFFALVYAAWFIALSFGLYSFLKEYFPDLDPFSAANRFVLYWLSFDLAVRYFFQKLPNLGIASLLVLNIRKSRIIHYVLGRSFFSFLNLIAAFASIPFALTLLAKGYESIQIVTWLIFLLLITMTVNCLHVILTSKEGVGKEYVAVAFFSVLSLISALDYFQVFSLGTILGGGIDFLSSHPYWLSIPACVFAVIYFLAYKTLRTHFYLDAVLQVKHKNRKTKNLSWMEQFGSLAPLLKMDLRMIWRNKRTKGLLLSAVFVLLYGLIFYQKDKDPNTFSMFIGLFMTGLFIYNFGMYIPGWDGSYYRFLMSRNIEMRTYLRSKYWLLVSSGIIAFVFTIPYLYFGWEVVLIHFTGFIYNIGIVTLFMLYYGSNKKKAMDLNSSATFNYQGVSGRDMLIMLPVFVVPMIVFGILKYISGLYVAVAFFCFIGILGLVLREKILTKIAKRYQRNKYRMLTGFSQN